MFTNKTVDSIVGNIQKQIVELKTLADVQGQRAFILQDQANEARAESVRATRLAGKFEDLVK